LIVFINLFTLVVCTVKNYRTQKKIDLRGCIVLISYFVNYLSVSFKRAHQKNAPTNVTMRKFNLKFYSRILQNLWGDYQSYI